MKNLTTQLVLHHTATLVVFWCEVQKNCLPKQPHIQKYGLIFIPKLTNFSVRNPARDHFETRETPFGTMRNDIFLF